MRFVLALMIAGLFVLSGCGSSSTGVTSDTSDTSGSDVISQSSSTDSQTTTLANQISNSPLETAKSGSVYSFIPEISNADGSTLTYSVENLPTWASFDSSTGTLTGTAVTGTYSDINITVSDAKAADTNSVSFSITVTPWLLTKSGQTVSYADYDDGYYQYGTANSFTRDSAGVVTDNVNGLMWQDTASPSHLSWTNAKTYCSDLTLDGYSDWRLPSITDLESIVNYAATEPSATSQFYNTGDYRYWTSTSSIQSTDQAWYVDFTYGTESTDYKYADDFVKCVRGNSTPLKSFTRDDSTEIVTDNNLGLMWQDDSDAATQKMYWGDAVSYCENKTLGGYSDWRMPNIRELLTLVDRSQNAPAISSAFIYKVADLYWSSTQYAYLTTLKQTINFNTGTTYEIYNTTTYVRCVRGGQK